MYVYIILVEEGYYFNLVQVITENLKWQFGLSFTVKIENIFVFGMEHWHKVKYGEKSEYSLRHCIGRGQKMKRIHELIIPRCVLLNEQASYLVFTVILSHSLVYKCICSCIEFI